MAFWIVAEMTVKPELKEEFLREVQYIVDESNREPGMVVYTLCQAAPSIKDLTPQGDKFYMVEQYKDKDAFKHHATSPHFKKWSAVSGRYRTMGELKFLAPLVVNHKPKM